MTRLDRFREHRDAFFASDPDSPLTAAQRERFDGLSYYEERPDLRFIVTPNRDSQGSESLLLETSDGESASFHRIGAIDVDIDGVPISLTLLHQPGRGRLFLPFRDGSAGDETYALGRYLDPQEQPDGSLIVDFNYAYNPYCAYGDGWSCPIPPSENVLDVPVRAGERVFPLTP